MDTKKIKIAEIVMKRFDMIDLSFFSEKIPDGGIRLRSPKLPYACG
jgi:hypothetical protein